MKANFRLITPKEAEKLLEKNTMNRLIKKFLLQEYTRQMSADLWKENTGEAIKIASDGTILDGQHRLYALMKSGKTLSFLIIEDMEKEVFPVLDSGAKRTPGDVLFIGGISNGRNVAGGIRSYFNLKSYKGITRGVGISNNEIFNLYNKRPHFWEGVYTMASGWYRTSSRILTIGEFIGFYAFFYDIDQNDAFTFMISLAEGANLANTDPIHRLREKLLFGKVNQKFTIVLSMKTALIIKAWNAFREGRDIHQLSYNSEKEKYPIAK